MPGGPSAGTFDSGGGLGMDPFTIALLGGGALLNWWSGRSSGKRQDRLTDRQFEHQDKWNTRDDEWRTKVYQQSERDRQIRFALMRAHREDFRPYGQMGVGALTTLGSALGIRPAEGMGGDAHVPSYTPTPPPQRLADLG